MPNFAPKSKKNIKMEKVQFGKYVELAYEIFTVDETGSTSVYEFTADHPDGFVFGQDLGMIEAFTQHIGELSMGDAFDFTLEPAEAFGERKAEMVMDIPRTTFLVEGEFDNERVYVGAVVPMQISDGYRIDGFVKAIDEENVTLDFNHQLAGQRVRYAGKVLLVRDATPEELAPKHGCGGCGGGCGRDHDHGCNCDSCGGCD